MALGCQVFVYCKKQGHSLDIVVVGIFLLRRGRSKRKSACNTVLAIGKTEGSTVSGRIVETFVGIIGLVDINI